MLEIKDQDRYMEMSYIEKFLLAKVTLNNISSNKAVHQWLPASSRINPFSFR